MVPGQTVHIMCPIHCCKKDSMYARLIHYTLQCDIFDINMVANQIYHPGKVPNSITDTSTNGSPEVPHVCSTKSR